MKKKILLVALAVAMFVCLFAISVSAEEGPYASYYDKTYVTTDNVELALYEKEGDTFYPLAWFYDSENAKYESFRVGTEVIFTQADGVTPLPAWTDFTQNTPVKFADESVTYGIANMILVNLQGSSINMFSGSWTSLPIQAIYNNTSLAYINGSAFNKNQSLTVFDIPKAHTGKLAFNQFCLANCPNLKELYIPQNAHFRSTSAFEYSGLVKVEFAENWAPIEHFSNESTNPDLPGYTFNQCRQLQEIKLPSNLLSIGAREFYQCTSLVSVELPTTLTSLGNAVFEDCDSLKAVYPAGTTSVEYAIILPEGITSIGGRALWGVDTIKYIKLPSTLQTIGAEALRNNDNLQYIDYSNCGITGSVGNYEYYDNKNMVAVSLPSGITSLNASGVFNACSNLEVLWLPDNLTSIGSFNGCQKLYFTDKPFTLDWYDGIFDTDDWGGQKPAKPEIYYFPSGLTNFGEAFNSCHALNDIIVFPAGVTTISHQYTFYNLNGKNFAFQGVVTSFLQNSNAKSNYYFLNDTVTADTLTATGNANRNFYFHSEGVHLCEKVTTVEATCVTNRADIKYCFCDAEIDVAEVENTALGHNHTIATGMVYVSFLENGYKGYKCERCDDVNKDEIAPALFVCQGYSAPLYGNGGMLMGFTVNKNAISAYTDATGKTLSYGLFAGVDTKLGTNEAISKEGVAQNGAVSVDFTTRNYDIMEIKVVGFETTAHKEAQVILGAYVIETNGDEKTVSYLQNGEIAEGKKYVSMSYNDLVPSNS
ncbi:MAG: leucine-rich repeat domain-containing protein [Clostridia bacterium]|nr:leucine-rich repeat domain-containing protein [Clostridia bacterium]